MTSNAELKINKNTIASKTTKFLIINEEIDEKILTSKFLKKAITGHNLSKKSKNNNQLWWAILGVIISILTWQLSSETFISIYGSIILILISLFLYIDYIFQKEKILLKIFFNGNFISYTIDEEVDEIENFFKNLY
ncbi:MAG: hypothetical protein VYD40_00770 [Chloroflexota bacterium]|nr:hypothetical protein [Chloroflexota bacterium]